MKKLFIIIGILTIAPGLWAQNQRIEEYAQKLSLQWLRDGVQIKTGFEIDGTQNLAVLAQGGYFPMKMKAKAGFKSILRVYTNKTYDCSRGFTLPDLKVQAILPAKGFKEFPIPPMKKGQTLFGTCGMGMYSFSIVFE